MKTGQLSLKKENLASVDDINRLRAQELLILMVGFNNGLLAKVSLLAKHQNDNRIVFLNDTDTFIYAGHKTAENEISIANALDELYRNECKIFAVNQSNFLTSHSSEEDIKTIISLVQPKHYIPIAGSFKLLLANAKVALNENNLIKKHKPFFNCMLIPPLYFSGTFISLCPFRLVIFIANNSLLFDWLRKETSTFSCGFPDKPSTTVQRNRLLGSF